LINRSLGVDQRSQVEGDYIQDPAAIDYPNPVFFQRSIRMLDPAATGLLAGTQGAYRNPAPLPNGNLLVSYAGNVTTLESFNGNFDIVVVDVVTGARTPLIMGAEDELWPVGVYPRAASSVFRSRLDEANGASQVFNDADHRAVSEVTFIDTGLISSLIFQNTRSGRVLPGSPLALQGVWESLPPVGAKSFADADPSFVTSDDYGQVYVRRRLLGSPEIFADGSASMLIRGGTPITLEVLAQLAGDNAPVAHFQREEMQFYPGEVVRQGFRRDLFDGLCGGCHGSVSGMENEVAVNPDILTQASDVVAITKPPTDLSGAVGEDVGP
jgi:hypothetical protein